jgi:hypothetical protein
LVTVTPVLSGAKIGILGSGQLGRMLALTVGDNNEFEKLTN